MPGWEFFLLAGTDQGNNSRPQLGVRRFALGDQTNQIGEQGFVHVSPVDGLGYTSCDRAPEISNAPLNHENGLVGSGEQAVP